MNILNGKRNEIINNNHLPVFDSDITEPTSETNLK